MRYILQIIVAITLIFSSGIQCLGERVCVIAGHGKDKRLKIYDIIGQSKFVLVRSCKLKGFLSTRFVPMRPGTGFSHPTKIVEIDVEQLLISPNLSSLACIYFLALPNEVRHYEIRIYDLSSGDLSHTITISGKDHKADWCKWKDSATLLFQEHFDNKIEVFEYSMKVRTKTPISTKVLPGELYTDPEDAYYKSAVLAADAFNRAGLQLKDIYGYSSPFRYSDFGTYRSIGRGAVSEDASYATANSDVFAPKHYPILKNGKVICQVELPAKSFANRVKFISSFLAIEVNNDGSSSINFYDKDSGKLKFSMNANMCTAPLKLDTI